MRGLAEEVHRLFPAGSFDLAYSFAVLEYVRDVERTIAAITTVLRRADGSASWSRCTSSA